MRWSSRTISGFTLVELLVVIGIIGVLVAILLPVMGKARRASNDVYCRSNLKQIAMATRMYANDNRDRYPNGFVVGGSSVRLLPGMRTPTDPAAIPETFGLPAVFLEGGYLKNLNVWKCPNARPEVQEWGNTYIWALLGGTSLADVSNPAATNNAGWTSIQRSRSVARKGSVNLNTFWVWDNWTTYPWLSGFRRLSGSNGAIPAAQQVYPHDYRAKHIAGRRQGSINMVFLDGHVGVVAYVLTPGQTTPETNFLRDP